MQSTVTQSTLCIAKGIYSNYSAFQTLIYKLTHQNKASVTCFKNYSTIQQKNASACIPWYVSFNTFCSASHSHFISAFLLAC